MTLRAKGLVWTVESFTLGGDKNEADSPRNDFTVLTTRWAVVSSCVPTSCCKMASLKTVHVNSECCKQSVKKGDVIAMKSKL